MFAQGKFDFAGKNSEGKDYKIDVEMFGKLDVEASKWTNTGRQVQACATVPSRSQTESSAMTLCSSVQLGAPDEGQRRRR